MTHLECTRCGVHFDPGCLQTFCHACNAPLAACYDLQAARRKLDRTLIAARPRGMWRWQELLPLADIDRAVSLGEGDTPLLALPRLGERLGMPGLLLKDESLNPTLSFKARGMAAAVSMARILGAKRLIVPTAGNAGGALAAYAARAGLPACIYMPADTPRANVLECQVAGAEVVMVDGLINEAGRQAALRAAAEDWFDLSTFKEPYRLEGKKVMGFELAEALHWRLPDVILYPTGGGTGLVGLWKAFQELRELGWLESASMPRMVAVQAAGCAPVVRAFSQGADDVSLWEGASTGASGLRVPRPFAGRMILEALRASGGTALAVAEDDLWAAQRVLADVEGIFAAPEGAALVAALQALLAAGWLRRDEKVLLLNTGSGLKYLEPALV
ncbi:MAG: threonine synthase [Anaerolineae bacterium]|nr:threonine synthase [Anaerolineae bacterium]